MDAFESMSLTVAEEGFAITRTGKKQSHLNKTGYKNAISKILSYMKDHGVEMPEDLDAINKAFRSKTLAINAGNTAGAAFTASAGGYTMVTTYSPPTPFKIGDAYVGITNGNFNRFDYLFIPVVMSNGKIKVATLTTRQIAKYMNDSCTAVDTSEANKLIKKYGTKMSALTK